MDFLKRLSIAVYIALALALGGCASQPAKADLKAGQQAAGHRYVAAEQFKTMDFPPPPVPGSPAQKADFSVVMDWQAKRTARSRRE